MKQTWLFLLLASAASLTACSSHPDEAREALTEQGYTQIDMTGSPFIGCDQDDLYRNSFVATSPGGIKVKGVACASYGKGWTIRTHRVIER